MKHIQQDLYECVPATIAMLAEVDLKAIKQELETELGRSWQDQITTFLGSKIEDSANNITRHVAKKFGVVLPTTFRVHYKEEELPIAGNSKDTTYNLFGCGYIITVCTEPRRAHMVAFEDNIVYDPGLAQPYPGPSWFEYYKREGFTVFDVQRIGGEE